MYFVNQRGTQWILYRASLTEHGFAVNQRRVSGHETEEEAIAALTHRVATPPAQEEGER